MLIRISKQKPHKLVSACEASSCPSAPPGTRTTNLLIPCQVIRRARGITLRLIGYQPTLDWLLSTWLTIKRTGFCLTRDIPDPAQRGEPPTPGSVSRGARELALAWVSAIALNLARPLVFTRPPPYRPRLSEMWALRTPTSS